MNKGLKNAICCDWDCFLLSNVPTVGHRWWPSSGQRICIVHFGCMDANLYYTSISIMVTMGYIHFASCV